MKSAPTSLVLAVLILSIACLTNSAPRAKATLSISSTAPEATTSIAAATAPTPTTISAGPQQAPLTHLHDAQLIALAIDSAHNEYAHKDCFIHWKGDPNTPVYENRTDCSDFLNLLLEHSYQLTPDDLHALTGHQRPTASDWYETIHAGAALDSVSTIQQIQPGDVIAIQYPPGEEDTGHVVIAAATARLRTPTAPLIPNTTQYELLVIDSSKSGHGPKDTRHHPDGSFDRGVGQGTLRLYANPDNSPAGYAWSTLSVSQFQPITEHKLTIGRLKTQTTQPSP